MSVVKWGNHPVTRLPQVWGWGLDGCFLMSQVNFKRNTCQRSLTFSCPISPLRLVGFDNACRNVRISYDILFIATLMSLGPFMLHVDIKKIKCRRIKFEGQAPERCRSIQNAFSDFLWLVLMSVMNVELHSFPRELFQLPEETFPSHIFVKDLILHTL